MDLVLGVDAGGTASRAVVATVSGEIVGRGVAGPGNPVSAGSAAATAIGTAISRALGSVSPATVAAGVLGVSGVDGTTDPAAAVFGPMWHDLGLTCPLSVVGDVVTAFAAGTPSPSGTVLIAGTGAIAARVTGHRVTATADGLGWLLGDEGSGRWIGLQAVRAAVRDWSGPLGRLVAARSGAASPEEAVRWAQALPLAEIGALTPSVCSAARTGSPAAARIITAAVDHLIATLDSLTAPTPAAWFADDPAVAAAQSLATDDPADAAPQRLAADGPADAAAQSLATDDPADAAPQRLAADDHADAAWHPPAASGPAGAASWPAASPDLARAAFHRLAAPGPVVLAGSLLVADTPVREGVLGVLEKREVPHGTARDPAGAAAWLAACGMGLSSPSLHAALCGV